MINLITSALLFAIILLSPPVKAQKHLVEPVKGANTIFIRLPVSGDSAWVRVGQALFRHQFAIRASDKTLGTITTDERYDVSSDSMLSFSVLFVGQVVTLHGSERFGPAGRAEPISVKGGAAGMAMQQWRQMDALAHSMGNEITYGIQ